MRLTFRGRTRAVVAATGCLLAVACIMPAATAATPARLTLTSAPGPTPFIAFVTASGVNPGQVTKASFSIAAKPGSTTPALTGSYTRSALVARGGLDSPRGTVTIPVYGLFAGYANSVNISLATPTGSVAAKLVITTPAWTGAAADAFANIERVVPRNPSVTLTYHFILMKYFASANSPVVLDIDGNVRWAGPAGSRAQSVIFSGNSFYLGRRESATVYRLDLDGTQTEVGDFSSSGVTGFHHNVGLGKAGFLFEANRIGDIDSTIVEVNAAGQRTGLWDLAEAVSAAMRAGGDDPSEFVRRGEDWCHSNSAVYWPAQNQVVVSCRQQFVIGVDYATGALRWILGEPTKSWALYPSLRKLALTVSGKPPIGQHALSFTTSSELLLFDNGLRSASVGIGQPTGLNRLESAPRRYRLDLKKRTAKEVWSYERVPAIYSPITSSVYQLGTSLLVNYAAEGVLGPAGTPTFVRLVGLDARGVIGFEYRWPGPVTFAWNATPIVLNRLTVG